MTTLVRANAHRARHLLATWQDDTKPALGQLEEATRAFLAALNNTRSELMWADDVKKVDALACDTASAVLDLLSDLTGSLRRELDDAGGDTDDMTLSVSVLSDERVEWEKRWRARR